MTILPAPPDFACICCGSKALAESRRRQRLHAKICVACMDEFERWLLTTKRAKSENALNAWLARRLIIESERLAKNGVAGRCEAVTKGPAGWKYGYVAQCRGRAVALHDGRRICGGHMRSKNITFICTEAHDTYNDLRTILTRLAGVDQKFRECMVIALANTNEQAA